jgi:RNA polymerase sigma-54 factor
LTPQLQQSIRLLQLSTLELNQEIEQALQENPLLEREEPGDALALATFTPGAPDAMVNVKADSPGDERGTEERAQNAADDFGWGAEMPGGHGSRDPNDENDPDSGEIQAAATSLRDHLNMQLALTQLDGRARALVGFLIEALDDDGYLAQTLDELADVLLAPEGLTEDREELLEELNIALRHLQNFDPLGIGARSPRECLELQLAYDPPSPCRELALAIVRNHLELLAHRDFVRLKKALGCEDESLRAAHALIKSLNPRPGAQYAALDTRYVIPDAVVRKLRGNWVASLNPDAMPKLRINRLYASLLQKSRSSGGANLSGKSLCCRGHRAPTPGTQGNQADTGRGRAFQAARGCRQA